MPWQFWRLSLAEALDIVEAYRERRKADIKNLFTEADAIASRISAILASKEDKAKVKIAHPWDYYPALFEEDRKRFEEEQQKIELENFKAQKRQYAARINARNRQRRNNAPEIAPEEAQITD